MDAISKESCSTECFLRHKIGLNCTVGGTSRLREPMNGTVSVFRQLELEPWRVDTPVYLVDMQSVRLAFPPCLTDGIYTTGELEAMKGASAGTVPRACLGSCRLPLMMSPLERGPV